MRPWRENEGGRGTLWDKNLPKADGFGKLKKSVRNQLLVINSLSKSVSVITLVLSLNRKQEVSLDINVSTVPM